jgi:hypothetical protein
MDDMSDDPKQNRVEDSGQGGSEDTSLDTAKRIMERLVNTPPKPHEDMKVGRKAKAPGLTTGKGPAQPSAGPKNRSR